MRDNLGQILKDKLSAPYLDFRLTAVVLEFLSNFIHRQGFRPLFESEWNTVLQHIANREMVPAIKLVRSASAPLPQFAPPRSETSDFGRYYKTYGLNGPGLRLMDSKQIVDWLDDNFSTVRR